MERAEFVIQRTKLALVTGDITRQETAAIVNAANSSLLGGGGVDGAIHRAGGPRILEECKRIVANIGSLPAGEAVITTGGNLRSLYVIHTVGPVWSGGNNNEATVLKNAYLNSLKLAKDNRITSLSFPSISTGAYRFPVERAAAVAVAAIAGFVREFPVFEEVRLVLWSVEDFAVCRDAARQFFTHGKKI
jgi:O-acetyl-ADP-ribose deacetylase (regulator of RNase III)